MTKGITMAPRIPKPGEMKKTTKKKPSKKQEKKSGYSK